MEVKVKMLNGKITSKDIINRRYDGKECIGFTYNLIVENEKGKLEELPCYYRKLAEKYWEVTMITKKVNINELKAYNQEYTIPTNSITLEMIAAMGLKYIQYVLQEEIQMKSMIDFCIGDSISGMY